MATSNFHVAGHAVLMTGSDVLPDPDHNGQLLPAGRKLQPFWNAASVVIIFLSYKTQEYIATTLRRRGTNKEKK